MSAYQDAVQRAEVLILAVVSALLDGAFDALVGMIVHGNTSFFQSSVLVCAGKKEITMVKTGIN